MPFFQHATQFTFRSTFNILIQKFIVKIIKSFMNKDDIIRNISKRNQQLQSQLKIWKEKYYMMEKAYEQLLNARNSQNNILPQETQTHNLNQTLISQNFFPCRTTTSPEKKEESSKSPKKQSPIKSNNNNEKQVSNNSEDMFDFFSQNLTKGFEVPKKVCELIEGCFIIEKISSIDHFDSLRFIYPLGKFDKIRSLFDIIYRYIFVDEKIPQILDDQYDSRKNEINFGTPSEDFQFVFDNISEKEGEKGRINDFQRITHIIRKRYIYGVVRPELITVNKQSYETQLAYGFISAAPFPNFFKDLNRIVQQQLKFRMLNMNKDYIGKKQKVDIISQILKDFTSKSLQKSLAVTSYPINLQLKANICGLRLVYNSKSNYVSDQFNYIQSFIHKFNLLKVIKIFHYMLTEQHIIVICKNRKNLNQLFQVLRSFIYPFNWIFPIVYYYSNFFQPFLSSPLPIIIGYIDSSIEGQELNNPKLPSNDFITINVEQQSQENDLKEIQSFKKRIKKCYKHFSKSNRQPKSSKQISPLIQKSPDQRLTYKFYNYTRKLRSFIETGKIQQQIDDFHIQFMQSQLASYYKQNKEQLCKKNRQV